MANAVMLFNYSETKVGKLRCITYLNGDVEYYNSLNELHRENGPAVINADGIQYWLVKGQLHRECAPAFIMDGRIEWFIYDKNITKEVDQWMKKYSISPDWKEWTDQEKIMFKFMFL